MEKKLIIHIIDSLSLGGAEILLRNTLDLLTEYDHLVIYFQEGNDIRPGFPSTTRFVQIRYKGWGDVFKTVMRLRAIIRNENPLLVHSHLLLSSVLARLATPRNISLVNTLHSIYSIDAFRKNRKSLWVERKTLKKHHSLVGVSRFVLDDYLSFVPFKGKRYVLYNFLPDRFFQTTKNTRNEHEDLKCIAVGNLKEAKNYQYLLEIMAAISSSPVTLDIYGDGSLKKILQEEIDKKKLRVRLCGTSDDTPAIFSEYDLFIQASSHEGFGLSVIEAIAAKLPLFVSDIPIFREITSELAHFFPLNDSGRAVAILHSLIKNTEMRNLYIDEAYKMAKEKYSQAGYHSQLLKIYTSALSEKIN